MYTRTQLKQLWNLSSAAKVDEIAIALFGKKHASYTEEQEAQMHEVLKLMQARKCSAVQAVAELSQGRQEGRATAAPGEDPDNSAYTGAQAGFSEMQSDMAEALLPVAVEAAIQAHETFYQATAILMGSPAITGSERVQAAKGKLRAAFFRTWQDNGGLAQRANRLINSQSQALAQMASGDTISEMPPASAPLAALPSTTLEDALED